MIKQSEKTANELFQVEAAIDSLLADGQKIFTVDDIANMAAPVQDEEAKKLFLSRIVRELDYHESLIAIAPGEKYIAAAELFKDAEFLIVPDGFEIENNILIPGHRFVAFMSQELFPSDITLKEAGARKRQSFREFSGQAENIIKYHLLMGAETLFDFFAAEANENMVNANNSANPTLKLSVLDMQKFYAETDFTEGDALLIKVKDYAQGEFEFQLVNGKLRNSKKADQYRERFESVLTSVVEDIQPGAPIVDALRCTFANASELLKSPQMSLDEMLMSDSAFDIAFDEDGSTLVRHSEEDLCDCTHEHHSDDCDCGHHHENDHRLPENVTIGSGETGSLETMLGKLYPMLTLVELDAILLDNFKNHDFDFNSFYARAFGENNIEFVDGMQEACFFNELESRFEELLDNYPREFDNESAAIRSLIVEFTMERCTVLAELAELAEDIEIKSELFEDLAEAVLLLDESLKLVNAPAALPEDFDYAELRKGVENALESGEDALARLRGVLESND